MNNTTEKNSKKRKHIQSDSDKFKEWLSARRKAGLGIRQILHELGLPTELPASDDELNALIDYIATKPNPYLIISELRYELQASDEAESINETVRKKLAYINKLEDVLDLLQKCTNIIVLSGAGISVSCGIPDFRSPGGLYDQIQQKYNMSDPHCLFDLNYLKQNPTPFFDFAKHLYPNPKTKPSIAHKFIKYLEKRNKLLRNYTQNIDTLEEVCGIKRAILCHGSFSTATCITCKTKVSGLSIRDEIMKRKIPFCRNCNDNKSFMKPDIVFFGEPLPREFGENVLKDCRQCDLLIVMGSSLRVQPVALIPKIIAEINPEVPQILINKELIYEPHEWDYALLGDLDQNVQMICDRLQWDLSMVENDIKSHSKNEMSAVHVLVPRKKVNTTSTPETSQFTSTATTSSSVIARDVFDNNESFVSSAAASKNNVSVSKTLPLASSLHLSKKSPQLSFHEQQQQQKTQSQQSQEHSLPVSSSALSNVTATTINTSLSSSQLQQTIPMSSTTLTDSTKNERSNRESKSSQPIVLSSSRECSDQRSQTTHDETLKLSSTHSYSSPQSSLKETNVEASSRPQSPTPKVLTSSLSPKLSPKPPRAYVTVTFDNDERESPHLLPQPSLSSSAPSPTLSSSTSVVPPASVYESSSLSETPTKEKRLSSSTPIDSPESLLKKKRKKKKHRIISNDNSDRGHTQVVHAIAAQMNQQLSDSTISLIETNTGQDKFPSSLSAASTSQSHSQSVIPTHNSASEASSSRIVSMSLSTTSASPTTPPTAVSSSVNTQQSLQALSSSEILKKKRRKKRKKPQNVVSSGPQLILPTFSVPISNVNIQTSTSTGENSQVLIRTLPTPPHSQTRSVGTFSPQHVSSQGQSSPQFSSPQLPQSTSSIQQQSQGRSNVFKLRGSVTRLRPKLFRQLNMHSFVATPTVPYSISKDGKKSGSLLRGQILPETAAYFEAVKLKYFLFHSKKRSSSTQTSPSTSPPTTPRGELPPPRTEILPKPKESPIGHHEETKEPIKESNLEQKKRRKRKHSRSRSRSRGRHHVASILTSLSEYPQRVDSHRPPPTHKDSITQPTDSSNTTVHNNYQSPTVQRIHNISVNTTSPSKESTQKNAENFVSVREIESEAVAESTKEQNVPTSNSEMKTVSCPNKPEQSTPLNTDIMQVSPPTNDHLNNTNNNNTSHDGNRIFVEESTTIPKPPKKRIKTDASVV
jgi:NAD-dependent SIR2 family protein deacetylase